MPSPTFGPIPGVPVGAQFASRAEVAEAGIHRQHQSGIVGRPSVGAESIVVSGGYVDDEDFGNVIIYTGHGGRDVKSGLQVADQELTRGNLALARNSDEGIPLRVVRGSSGDPRHSPTHGYRYDGLYYVETYWSEVGEAGFTIWRFRLVAEEIVNPWPASGSGDKPVPRATGTTQRLVRNTSLSARVKALYAHTCQICGERIDTAAGPYAEGAHIRPLGRPHDGPDALSNLLCLCPNDHVRFEHGALFISDEFKVIDASGAVQTDLAVVNDHDISLAHVRYHRSLFSLTR